MLKFTVTCHYGNHLVRGMFGISSPPPEEQRVAPQPTAPTENIYYEIPSGMIEKLLANPYAGDGTLHPHMRLIYVDEVCGLFKLTGLPGDEVIRSSLYLCIGYVMILELGIVTN